MTRYSHLREISILPCLPAGLSVEDEMLSPTAPSFGLQHVYPNAALARVLGFLNISKPQFLALVESRKGIKLTSSKANGPDTGLAGHSMTIWPGIPRHLATPGNRGRFPCGQAFARLTRVGSGVGCREQ